MLSGEDSAIAVNRFDRLSRLEMTSSDCNAIPELGPNSAFLAVARCVRELVFVWKPTGEMLWVNPAFERETGMSVEDFGFRNADNPFIHPDDLPSVQEQIGAFLASSDLQSPPVSNRFFDAWGRVRALTSIISKVTWANEPALLLVTTINAPASSETDDTGEVQRGLMESIGDGVLELSREGLILFSNRTFQRLVGRRPIELARCPFSDMFTADTREPCEVALAAVHAGERDARFEAVLANDGRVLDVRLSRVDLANRNTSALAVTRDITALRRAEQVASSSETRFRELFDGAADAFYILNSEFMLTDVNRAACVSIGASKGELVGLHSSVVEVDARAIDPKSVGEQLRTRGFATREGVHRRKDGTTFPVEVNITPFDRDGQRYYFASARDITDRKQAESDRAKLENALRHSQKLESIGRLAGGVAHDFNNMLTAIGGNVALALADLTPTDPLRELLTDVERATDSAANLTRQLLAFSRKQMIEPKVLSLNEVILQWQKMLQRLLGEDITLQSKLAERVSPVKIDPGQLEQVIVNLCVNARDAMPAGGTLTISTADVAIDESMQAAQTGLAPGRYVRLSIADNGQGMSEEVRSHLFEPFFTTKESGKGTGLGLAMVYGAVQQNGGHIEVDSEPNLGTTVRLYLRGAEQPPQQLVLGPRLDLPRGSEALLLVEDEAGVRNLATRVLSRLGYKVRAYPNGHDALSDVEIGDRSSGPRQPIDLLITDVIMPGINGRVLADRMRLLRPGLDVLFTSGYAEDVVGSQGILEEGLELLTKPYTINELAHRVRALLDRRR